MDLEAGIWALRLEFWPRGWDFGLDARNWALRLGFGPQGWDLGLKAGIRVGGRTDGGEEEEGGEGENSPYV